MEFFYSSPHEIKNLLQWYVFRALLPAQPDDTLFQVFFFKIIYYIFYKSGKSNIIPILLYV